MKNTNKLENIRRILSPHTESPYLAAQLLLSEVLDQPRSTVLAHPDPDLTPAQQNQLDEMVDQMRRGIPLPYVIGHWEFYRLDFQINPSVLIPRPETELLVEEALNWLSSHPSRRWAADVGTGSGCIAVSLAHQIPDLQVLASDLSRSALNTASQNARRQGVSSRVHLLQADLLTAVEKDFDLLIANLPYIPRPKLQQLPVYQREPTLALNGGEDGSEIIERLLSDARRSTAPGGMLLLEIDEDTGPKNLELSRKYFPESEIHLKTDLSGQDRYLKIKTQGDHQ